MQYSEEQVRNIREYDRKFYEERTRTIRDHDRRTYRFWMISLICYQIFIGVPVRIAADKAVDLLGYSAFKTYNIGIILVLVILMWVIGIWTTFRRRY